MASSKRPARMSASATASQPIHATGSGDSLVGGAEAPGSRAVAAMNPTPRVSMATPEPSGTSRLRAAAHCASDSSMRPVRRANTARKQWPWSSNSWKCRSAAISVSRWA